MTATVFEYIERSKGDVYDGIIAPENFEVAEIIAFVSGTKLMNQVVSVGIVCSVLQCERC